MPVSLYTASVGHFLQIVPPIAALIDKAEAHCAETGTAHDALASACLAEDMWPFAKQVAMVAAHSGGAIEGIRKGEFGPDLSPPPATFAEMRDRLAQAQDVLAGTSEAELEGLMGRDMCFKFGDFRRDFTVEDFLLTFSVPNFYFHATTAYAVLRNQGVKVGKMDFLGALRLKA